MHVNLHMALIAWATAAGPLLAADSGGSDGGSKLLSPDIGTAFWTLILFVGLLLVLGKLVWPKIVAGLEAREEKIKGDVTAAEQANAAAQKTLADYQQKLAEAHAEARKLVDQARKDAEALRAKLASDTEAELAKARQRAGEEIHQAKSAAIQELYAHSATLAVAVAEKILQRQINEADTGKLIEQTLAELQKMDKAV
jgi:F-type H+-transporting ATPase subunit b